jgi:hypothetical protein
MVLVFLLYSIYYLFFWEYYDVTRYTERLLRLLLKFVLVGGIYGVGFFHFRLRSVSWALSVWVFIYVLGMLFFLGFGWLEFWQVQYRPMTLLTRSFFNVLVTPTPFVSLLVVGTFQRAAIS